MRTSQGRTRWLLAATAGLGLVAIGMALGARLWRSPAPTPADARMDMPAGDGAGAGPGSGATAPEADEVVVALTPDMVARARIKTVPATPGTATRRLHLPGVVRPNGYKEVTVTATVSGRVTEVGAELGKHVKPGDVIARLYSPELAEAQTAFVSARAALTAHDQRQVRAQRLFAIGAVSRQELDMLEADGSRMGAAVESARARLVLLGLPAERTQKLTSLRDVVATFDVQAPMAGVVTTRSANPGLNVTPAMPLFTIVDLATVWVMADLYERDFAGVRVGSPATITTASYPGLTLNGRVGYIDPQVQEETRTAKLRVEVPNPGGRLRFGMYVDVAVGEASTGPVVFVPKAAVQVVGPDSVVYVAAEGQHGRFVQRKVEVGETSGDRVGVLAGLQPGDHVVTEGAFFLRAERQRASPGATESK